MANNETEVDQPLEGSAGKNYVNKCGVIWIGGYLLFVTFALFVSLYWCWKCWPSCQPQLPDNIAPSGNQTAKDPPGPSPDVDSVLPTSGLFNGGTRVTITGKEFQQNAKVRFGGMPATDVEFVNSTSLTALTPPHAEEEVGVMVINPDGGNDTLLRGYRYTCPVPDRALLFIIIILAGALGGAIHALRSFSWYVGNRRLVWSWVPTYIILPFSGAGIAVIFYLVIGAGFFSPESTNNDSSLIIIGFATLVGLFSQQAALKLQDIANAILTKPEQGKDQATQTSTVTVATVTRNEGHIKGGNEVTITGTGFVDEAVVKFGGVAASDIKVLNNTTITCKVPHHDPGKVNVVVTNPDGQSDTLTRGYTYTEKTDLTVTSVERGEGSTSGDEEVSITGTGFLEGATVKFGEEPALDIKVTSTEITVKTPPHPAATVDVTVTNPGGQSSSLPDGYTYTDGEMPTDGGERSAPEIDKRSGPTAGGEEVKITGTGFSSVKEVIFGGVPVPDPDVSLDSATSTITVLTPQHTAGEVEVEVTNMEGEKVKLEQKYTYV